MASNNNSSEQKLSVISQVYEALKSPVALTFGVLLGAFIPCAIFFVAHQEVKQFSWDYIVPMILVFGGLVYSAKTVWIWTNHAFSCPYKATGFVLLTEGVMTFSHIEWLSTVALCYLAVINAVATGCQLALSYQKDLTKKAVKKPTKKVASVKPPAQMSKSKVSRDLFAA